MEKVTQNLPFSKAQRKQLTDLEVNVRIAIQQRDAFINYLREEHDAPADKWGIRSVDAGFELIENMKPELEIVRPTNVEQKA